jgi:hypothetical protein
MHDIYFWKLTERNGEQKTEGPTRVPNTSAVALYEPPGLTLITLQLSTECITGFIVILRIT